MNREKFSVELKALTERLGFEFVGVEIVHEAGTQVLRLYIDDQDGVSLDDCEKVSQAAGVLLDDRDQDFEDNYLLEVSSPGIERPLFKLEDYGRFAGRVVSLKLREPFLGRRRMSATIEGVLQDNILLNCEGEALNIPFGSISSAHLVYIEEKGQKKTFKKKGGKR